MKFFPYILYSSYDIVDKLTRTAKAPLCRPIAFWCHAPIPLLDKYQTTTCSTKDIVAILFKRLL